MTSTRITHMFRDVDDYHDAMSRSGGLNSPQKVKTLCGKTVSVFSIDKDCPTCNECQDVEIDELMFDFEMYQ